MVQLIQSLNNWGGEEFNAAFKQEVESLKNGDLPLSKGASISGYVDDSNLSVNIQNTSDTDSEITVEFGIFFGEIVIGCSCHDDPPVENSYCEMKAVINKESAETSFEVIA